MRKNQIVIQLRLYDIIQGHWFWNVSFHLSLFILNRHIYLYSNCKPYLILNGEVCVENL